MNTPQRFSPYQKFVGALLAFLQFTIILDFMVLSPLGAILIPSLNITPSQFGFAVSVYAFSAGLSGLLAAGFADRFDRKKLLLFFYAGFVFGTFLCAIATTYSFLLFARMVTGIFGGVIGSIVFAITTDLFPLEMRGRVMGIVQTSFSASQILGLPLALFLSNHFNWHMPFFMIVAVSMGVGALIIFYLKPVNEHLKVKVDKNPFHHLLHTLLKPRYLQGFATTALLSTGGFMLMPFGSAFSVNNLKISLEQLPVIYLVTGTFSMIAGPFIGRLCDSIGKLQVFVGGSLLTIAMVIIYTHLGVTSISLVILISIVLFTGVSSRMISSSALVSALPELSDRGAYMSISASIQQISGGLAAIVAGMVVKQNADGVLLHFEMIGYIVSGTTLITIAMMVAINHYIKNRSLILNFDNNLKPQA
jgi:predicted MFS family arabinose efflux permease